MIQVLKWIFWAVTFPLGMAYAALILVAIMIGTVGAAINYACKWFIFVFTARLQRQYDRMIP